MGKFFNRKRKLNQKGMTLIEVIVAMAILAVVVVPTLRVFVTSANVNLKSKLQHRATFVGESVMESFKAYSMEALCTQFQAGTFKGVDGAASMSVEATYPSGGVGSPLRSDGKLDHTAEKYLFKATDVDSENQHYDIEIEAEPVLTYNQDFLRTESPNAYSDAIIKLPESLNNEIQTALASAVQTKFNTDFPTLHPGGTSLSIDSTVLSDVKRTITITVTDDGVKQKVDLNIDCTCKARVNYHYIQGTGASATLCSGLYKDYTEADLLPYAVLLPDSTSTQTVMTVYDNSATIAGTAINGRINKLNNIYLYYFPAYSEIFGSGATDEIVLTGNLTNLYEQGSMNDEQAEATGYTPLKLVVAKQVTTSLSNVELNLSESTYNVSASSTLTGGGEVKIASNLRDNISAVVGSVGSPVTTTGFVADTKIGESLENNVELLYDVIIHIYQAGTTNEVARYEGTING